MHRQRRTDARNTDGPCNPFTFIAVEAKPQGLRRTDDRHLAITRVIVDLPITEPVIVCDSVRWLANATRPRSATVSSFQQGFSDISPLNGARFAMLPATRRG
jgi:hypothetical protein